MKAPRTLTAAALAAAFAVACSDSVSPDEATVEDLAGIYNATSVVFTPDAGGTAVDVIQLGYAYRLIISHEPSYTSQLTDPSEESEIETGAITVSNGVITLTPFQGEPYTLEILSFSEEGMTLRDGDAEFDFDEDDVDEPATVTVVLAKE